MPKQKKILNFNSLCLVLLLPSINVNLNKSLLTQIEHWLHYLPGEILHTHCLTDLYEAEDHSLSDVGDGVI